MDKPIILASGSPRRIEILQNNGIHPVIKPADVSENLPGGLTVEQAVMFLALKKALKTEEDVAEGIIIAADTVVYKDYIIGKPEDEQDAMRILRELNGQAHRVITGVAIVDANQNYKKVFYEVTEVRFKKYTDEDITLYLKTDEPWDKAGAYAIQGYWSKYVDRILGDYSNVVGLPWNRLKQELQSF